METQTVQNRGNNIAVAPKKIDLAKVVEQSRVKPKEVVKEDTRFKEIEGNPFFKIHVTENLDEEAKANLVAKTLTAETLKEYLAFDEWCSATQEKMASELIKLNDPEAMGELHQTYNDMGRDLMNFEDQARPFTEVLEAIYAIRSSGATLDVISEIKNRKIKRAQLEVELTAAKEETDTLRAEATRLVADNAALAQKKTLFGSVKESSRQQIAVNEVRLQEITTTLEQYVSRLNTTKAALDEVSQGSGELADETAKLEKFLDLSSESHKQQAEALKKAATDFINTSKTRVGSVRTHIESREEQLARFKKANKNMQLIYAINNAGVEKAFESNKNQSHELEKPIEGENLLNKAKREQTKESVDQFVKKLESVKTETLTSYARLSKQGVQVNSMKDGNEEQAGLVRNLHSSGIAEVADNLSVLLEGISGAALGEASAMAKEVLVGMNKRTADMTQKGVIKQALGMVETTREVERTIEAMASMHETLTAASEIRKNNLEQLRSLSTTLEEKAKELVGATQEMAAINTNLDTPKEIESKVEITKNPLAF